MDRVRAFCVHLLTASGAGLALVALMFAAERDFVAMFAVLGVALLVDGIDGPLARRWEVARLMPRWSGDALDLIVDYTTYVFVPAFAIVVSGLMPRPLAIACAIAITISAALYFADREMKSHDNRFKGFPAVWNVAAFYLLTLKPDDWITAAVIFCLVVLTFTPVYFVHPLRVRRHRTLNIAMLTAWSLLALHAVLSGLEANAWVGGGLLAIAGYFLVAGLRTTPGRE